MHVYQQKKQASFFFLNIEVICVYIYIYDFKAPLLKISLKIAMHPERRKAGVLSF